VPFTPEDVAVLRAVHDSCAASSVRGHRSAEELARIGVHNVVVTGCPTLFWERRTELSVRRPEPARTGFTFRTWLYSDDVGTYRAQLRALELLRASSGEVTVILQGEEEALQRLHIARHWGATHRGWLVWDEELAMHRLVREPLDVARLSAEVHAELDDLTEPATVNWLAERTFFSWDVADYLDLYRRLGLVAGCRLHSNLLSLSQGTPAYFLTYDDRTREVAELLSVPHRELRAVGDDLDPFGADWSPVEDTYRVRFAEMVRFLEANRLPHRLPAPAGTGAAPSAGGTNP
jgi:hypothetical protein